LAHEKTSHGVVTVGVAQFHVGRAPQRIMTMALGSCLGIVLFEATAKVGALAHVMHPRRSRVKNNSNRIKFVDTAIPLVVERMVQCGARREGIVAKIFGGARMFGSAIGFKGVLQIGDENIATAREQLAALGIPILAERVGGGRGRTIMLDAEDGSVRVTDVDGHEEIC
jgi:chemotaxis protein CheD